MSHDHLIDMCWECDQHTCESCQIRDNCNQREDRDDDGSECLVFDCENDAGVCFWEREGQAAESRCAS